MQFQRKKYLIIMEQKTKKSRLDEFIEAPNQALWKLSLPMMLGMAVQAIFMMADTAFVGRMIGGIALASLGYVFPYFFIIMGITFGLGSGATTVIAQYIGAEDKESADNSAEHSFLLAGILGIIILLGGFFFGQTILSLQGASGQALDYANDYYPIMLVGSVFMVFAVFFRSILSGEGDNKMPMMVLGIGTIINIVLDPIFIYYYA